MFQSYYFIKTETPYGLWHVRKPIQEKFKKLAIVNTKIKFKFLKQWDSEPWRKQIKSKKPKGGKWVTIRSAFYLPLMAGLTSAVTGNEREEDDFEKHPMSKDSIFVQILLQSAQCNPTQIDSPI